MAMMDVLIGDSIINVTFGKATQVNMVAVTFSLTFFVPMFPLAFGVPTIFVIFMP
jgi:hypothetical protein